MSTIDGTGPTVSFQTADSAPVYRVGQLRCRPGTSLWIAVAVAAVADLATTYYGLHIGLIEVNPIALFVRSVFGSGSLVGLKAVALAIAAHGYRRLGAHRTIVPSIFLAVWGVAVASNLWMLLTSG